MTMEWIGVILKLFSWHQVGKQNRSGFVLGIISNVCLGIPAYIAGLHGVAVSCILVSLVQLRSWWLWPKAGDNPSTQRSSTTS